MSLARHDLVLGAEEHERSDRSEDLLGGHARLRWDVGQHPVRRANPFKTFYSRLRQAGKPAKLALIAVARKLLTVLNAMMRDRKSYLQTNPT